MIVRIFTVALLLTTTTAARAEERGRPNVLWIVVEDMSQHFSYAGETTIETPHVDRLAAEGVVFERAYVTAPVCSPSRSALVTGMYQTSINAHHHRSYRGEIQQDLPSPVRTVPELFKEAGYYVSNGQDADGARRGKQDYNFNVPKDLYDGADWSGRNEGQPFFAQLQLRGGKRRDAEVANPVDPEDVSLPPYYPDDPVLREDWARYLDSVQYVDDEVGRILQRLEDEGVANNTVVIFMTDHGISHARGKQFLYDEGARIPFLVWAPGRVDSGASREDFVAHIDMAATSLYFADIEIPDWMEARPLFGPNAQAREYVVSARDRCDETVDRIRSVRHGNFKYIRNYYPHRPHLQPNRYKDDKPILKRMRELYEAGALDGHPAERLYTTPRPEEELYDLSADPWELNNLAYDPKYAEPLETMRGQLGEWIERTGDRGQQPEPEAVYDSDMALYLQKSDAHVIRRNIDTMKAWAAEGK